MLKFPAFLRRPLRWGQLVAAVATLAGPLLKAMDALLRIEGIWDISERLGVLGFVTSDLVWLAVTVGGFAYLGWSLRRRKTYRIADLPLKEGVLKNKVFVEDLFVGPMVLRVVPPFTKLQSPIPVDQSVACFTTQNAFYVAVQPDGDSIVSGAGVIPMVNCQLIRCRFQNVAFLVEPDQLDSLRFVLNVAAGHLRRLIPPEDRD